MRDLPRRERYIEGRAGEKLAIAQFGAHQAPPALFVIVQNSTAAAVKIGCCGRECFRGTTRLRRDKPD
jgi:hypothetical protein